MPMLVPISDLVAGDFKRCTERLDQPRGKRGGVKRLIDAGLHDGELVAAQTRHRIGLADFVAQAPGHRLQQRVTDRMAERIVHLLEVVEVEAQHGAGFVSSAARDGLAQPVVKQHAVWQLGQRVMMGHVGDFGFNPAPLRGVLQGDQPAVVFDRGEIDCQRAAIRQFPQVSFALAGQPHAGDAGLHCLDVHWAQVPAGTQETAHGFEGHPGADACGRYSEHLRGPAIDHDQAACRVEHQQRLRHVAQGSLEAKVLDAQYAIRP